MVLKYVENAGDYMLSVYDDASVTFTGKFRASQVRNVRSVFNNLGTVE